MKYHCHYPVKDNKTHIILRHLMSLNSGLTTVSSGNDTFISGYIGSDTYVKLIDEEYQYYTLALPDDTITWTTVNPTVFPPPTDQEGYWVNPPLIAAGYDHGKFVGVSSESYISDDGITWTHCEFLRANYSVFGTVVYGNGYWIVCDTDGGYSCVLTESNNQVNYYASLPTPVKGKSFIYHNNLWYGVNNVDNVAKVYTCSGDPSGSWTQLGALSSYFYNPCIVYGNNMFLIIERHDSYSKVSTSSDGITWTTPVNTMSAHDNKGIMSITFNGRKFVGLTIDGYVYTTSDGINWKLNSIIPSPATDQAQISNVYWRHIYVGPNNKLYAICGFREGYGSTLYYLGTTAIAS